MDIKQIDTRTVHRICSGQVVLTLAVAVKELIENALDAGATAVDVKLKEFGSKVIEVSDNGCGVEEHNFAGLALKHHTSKISNYEDLDCGVTTFGFRGEALSSLCSLSKLTITTKFKDSEVATKIFYDTDGRIADQCSCHRQVGTTVQMQDLFYSLPVRHKEFLRNLRREFQKLIRMVTSYCLISEGVKITLSNVTAEGKKSMVLATKGSADIRENIAALFGTKQLASLCKFTLDRPSGEILEEFNIKDEPESQPFAFQGQISTCDMRMGRGSSDRQFLYINGRPCEIDKLSKIINEVYHTRNKSQYPVVILNIQVDKGSVDVNLTPDKRKVLLDYESYLLATVKASLMKLWSNESNIFCNNTPEVAASVERCPGAPDESLSSKVSHKRSFSLSNFEAIKQIQQSKKRSTLDNYTSITQRPEHPAVHVTTHPDSSTTSKRLPSSDACPASLQLNNSAYSITEDRNPDTKTNGSTVDNYSIVETSESVEDCPLQDKLELDEDFEDSTSSDGQAARGENTTSIGGSTSTSTLDDDCKARSADSLTAVYEGSVSPSTSSSTGSPDCKSQDPRYSTNDDNIIISYDEAPSNRKLRDIDVSFSLAKLKEKAANRQAAMQARAQEVVCPKFRSKINPQQNQDAECELNQNIRKSDFLDMEVLGQFNLGFIIAKLRDDLFIVDQHATDEKYNFEMLQRNTVMQRQRLLAPMPLNLSSDNEILLIDNLKVFDKNGFEFVIKEDAEPTQRVSMVTQPVSLNWTFGKNDIDELLYLLRECPGRYHRPSRVRDMFATKACRRSIMIGKALDPKDMRKLLQHMSQIEQPWNCPHGRPTMRHLVNLALLADRTNMNGADAVTKTLNQ